MPSLSQLPPALPQLWNRLSEADRNVVAHELGFAEVPSADGIVIAARDLGRERQIRDAIGGRMAHAVVGGRPTQATNAAVPVDWSADPRMAMFHTAWKARIIGQPHVERDLGAWLIDNVVNAPGGFRGTEGIGFVGPSGTGKSSAAAVLSLALNGRPDAFYRVPLGQLVNSDQGHGIIIGGDVGYAGFDTVPKLSPKLVDAKFREGDIKLLFLDEWDKMFSQSPAAAEKLGAALASIWDSEGQLLLKNGEVLDCSRTLIIVTSNAGAVNARDFKVGDPRRQHYTRSAHSQMVEHLRSRLVGNFAFDSLDAASLARVAPIIVEEMIAQLKLKAPRLRDGAITVDPRLYEIAGRCTENEQLGVRVLRKFLIANFTRSLAGVVSLADLAKEDEGRFHIPAEAISPTALEKLRERSIAIQDDGQPAVFDPAFPIGTPKLTNPAPITWAFPAAFPFAAPDAETFGSGAVADRSFVLGRAAAGAENVLCLVQPGRTDADMTFEPVDTLPAVFKGCTELRTARLNDDEILITGVAIDAAAGGNRPRAHAPTAVWNARTGEFFEAEARPEVVIGSSCAGGGDVALSVGGRAPHFKDGALVTEPALLQGYPMAATAWSFKRETLTWEPANIDTKGLLLARTGMGAASRRNADGDTEVFFVGGEKRKATGIGFRDKTTAYVTRINLTTGAATALPNFVGDVSSPTVFFDQYGRLAVRQGVEWIRTDAEGWHYTPKRLFAALNVDDAKATWRERKPETATTEGAGAAAIPVIDAFVFGPVRMPDGTIGAEMYG